MSNTPHPIILQLRAARREQELSQNKVAEALGYCRWSIQNLEKKRHNTSFELIVDYADYLGFDIILRERRQRL